MPQKEVVNRSVAGPNSKAYGRLSVMAQLLSVIPVLGAAIRLHAAAQRDSAGASGSTRNNALPIKDIRVLSRNTTE